MRGHGIVVVARDVEQMLYASLILEDEAQKWVQASTLGEVQPMSHHDCETFAGKPEFAGRAQRCWRYFSEQDNGLFQDWAPNRCWMNPPYGREIGRWMKKAYEESLKGATVVCLVPARTDTAW